MEQRPVDTPYSIEHLLSTQRTDALELLNNYYDWQQSCALEDAELHQFAQMQRYADRLSVIMGVTDGVEKSAVYNAFHFGYIVSQKLGGEIPDKDFFVYILDKWPLPLEEQREAIANDVDMYIQQRPEVDGLITAYIDCMDPSSDKKYEMLCSTVAALTFMMADHAYAPRQQEAEIERFTRAVDAFSDGEHLPPDVC